MAVRVQRRSVFSRPPEWIYAPGKNEKRLCQDHCTAVEWQRWLAASRRQSVPAENHRICICAYPPDGV